MDIRSNLYKELPVWDKKRQFCGIRFMTDSLRDCLFLIAFLYLLQSSAESAMKVTEQSLDSLERLESFPESGSLVPDKWLNRKGYRMVISGRYVSIYRVIGEKVYVYHIADTQIEYTKLFSR